MKVHIQDNYYLESDSMQFMIKEYSNKIIEDKESGGEKVVETIKNHGYFPDIKAALNKFLKLKIQNSTAQDLKELIAEIKAIREFLEEQFT